MESSQGKRIVVIFGEMGAGKSFWGNRFATLSGLDFFEGDDVVPPKMAELVSKFKPIPRDLIKEYVDILATETARRAEQSIEGLIVSQALYSDKDRLRFKSSLEDKGFEVQFILIKPGFLQNLEQIYSRPNGFRWTLYWLMSKPWFEKPSHTCLTI